MAGGPELRNATKDTI
ncbi:uncharacterized protein FFB14_03911 [Fusarium fujikuroi]|nr:uncharacterized protein FFB14_03911 [Fusarium fujikuroi]